MIVVKLSAILNSMNVLRELSTKPLKGRAAYQLGKIIKKADEEFALFNETRQGLIEQYAIKDENGEFVLDKNGSYTFKGNDMKTFMDEIKSVMDSEVELNAAKVKLEDLEELSFTPAQMVLLEEFIEE